MRVQDPEGDWSPLFTTIVHLLEPPTLPGAIPDAALTQAEYFWDVDPGQGDATPLLALDGALDETVESILQSGIPLPAGTGPHTFNLRVQDPEGDWSQLFTTTVHILDPPTPPGAIRGVDIIEAEYFWDLDPGQGNGTPLLATDGAFDESVEALLNSNLPPSDYFGPHTFNLRVRDAVGTWSPTFTTVLYHTIDDGTGRPDLTGDPDKDGFDFLPEYFLGSRPFIPDAPSDYIQGGLEEELTLGPGQRLFLQINRTHVAPDVVIAPEISTNLLDWFNQDGDDFVTWIDSPGVLKYYAPQTIGVEVRQFFRFGLRYAPLP